MQLTWNLSELYSNNSQLEADIVRLKQAGEKIINTRTTLNTKQGLLNYFKLSEDFGILQDKIASYLFFTKSLDGSSVYAIEKLSELENYFQEFSTKTTFVSQELKKIDNKTLKLWSTLPEFTSYNNDLLDIIKLKKHTLPTAQEKLMIGAGYTVGYSEIFDAIDNVEIKFGKTINEQGKTVQLNQSNMRVMFVSNNKQVRKNAIKKVFKAYKALNQTISANYISHLKYSNFVAKTYKYKNTLDMCLSGSDLPTNLPQAVVKNVTEYLPLVHKYYKWRKDFMKLDQFESFDLSCNLYDSNLTPKYSLSQALEIIKLALNPLGESYCNMLGTAVKNNWIDSRYLPNKDTGAYSADVYGVHPYILLTYDDTLNSVSTLAHEFGHAMHSYYSQKNQPYAKHSYDIFVAEVASTVNEILLTDYLITNSKNKTEKITNITSFLNTFIATVFTQTQYTEFELFAHNSVDKNLPLSYKKLNDYYYKLQQKYIGKNVKIYADSKYHWSRIPHFYRSFYVFKYATGFISACAIVSKLKADKNYYTKYLNMLSAGNSLKPCDVLKLADVDILSKQTYKSAFKIFKDYLNQLTN